MVLGGFEEVSPPVQRSDWRGRGGREGDAIAGVPPHPLLFPSAFVEALASAPLHGFCPFWKEANGAAQPSKET